MSSKNLSSFIKDLDIKSNEGARCWNPGWGSETKDGEWAPNLKSIGVNLLGGISCKIRSYWPNLYENEICAVSAPTETTKVNGYGYHVVAGGKGACSGDFGSPLLCDIDGVNTLVGINSRRYDECGAEGYPAIHVSMKSVQTWIDDVIKNESDIIWSEWSQCDSNCKQTRKRTKYETEIRDCKGVCFKNTPDIIDENLKTCKLDVNRRKRNIDSEKRIMGGQNVASESMLYVVKLNFLDTGSSSEGDQWTSNQLCAGTVINKHFIATSKFCCDSGQSVTAIFNNQAAVSVQSNTFYTHSTFDSCLIRVEVDMSQTLVKIPCLPNQIDINKYNGAACWNAGWGTAEIDGSFSDTMQSIGINLMSREYCTDHSFWEIEEGYICAGMPPNDSTPKTGWKHVTAGGKETCQGDFGAPLICDIDGTATFIGINSDGDMTECGLIGKPAIHLNVLSITDWIKQIIDNNSPPKTCFKINTDPAMPNSLGDEIKLFKNGGEIGVALGSNQISNEICIDETSVADVFEFKNGGSDNVSTS